MRKILLLSLSGLLLIACGSSNPNDNKREVLQIPVDMPDICQNIDFNIDKSMREPCGVKPVRYQAYYNMPMQRHLINPNEALLVKTGNKIEIRFPNTFPVPLDSEQVAGVAFSDTKRLQKIKNTMDYSELYSERNERFKLFKITIPSDTQPVIENDLCFRAPEPKGRDRTRSAAMGIKMEMISCKVLDSLVQIYSTLN
jgi:hypothetical protein